MGYRGKRRVRYTKAPHPGRTAVYQFRDRQTQDHIYVGIANNLERRFAEHAGLSRDERKWWWDQADHGGVTVTWYSTRRQALAVETGLIKRLRPPGNKVGNPDWEATTTWRPPAFRGITTSAKIALAGWALVLTQSGGMWGEVPTEVSTLSLVATVAATCVAWRRIKA